MSNSPVCLQCDCDGEEKVHLLEVTEPQVKDGPTARSGLTCRCSGSSADVLPQSEIQLLDEVLHSKCY